MNDSNLESSQLNQHGSHEGFPWKHVIGFVLSIIFTVLALWVVFSMPLSATAQIIIILILAVFQVLVQLLLFMHLNEKTGPAYHLLSLIFGAFVAFTVVGGSIWIMAFRYVVS